MVAPEKGQIGGRVVISEYTGASSLLHIRLDGGETCLVVVDGDAPEAHTKVGLIDDTDNLHHFDTDGVALRKSRVLM